VIEKLYEQIGTIDLTYFLDAFSVRRPWHATGANPGPRILHLGRFDDEVQSVLDRRGSVAGHAMIVPGACAQHQPTPEMVKAKQFF
jgi:hypothetical protein